MKLAMACAIVVSFSSVALSQDSVLSISEIEMVKTPQSGKWSAGVTISQSIQPKNRDSWHSGKTKYQDGDRLPVSLELGGLKQGENVNLFAGLANNPDKAGTNQASDQLKLTLTIFPAKKEKVEEFRQGKWVVRVRYSVTRDK